MIDYDVKVNFVIFEHLILWLKVFYYGNDFIIYDVDITRSTYYEVWVTRKWLRFNANENGILRPSHDNVIVLNIVACCSYQIRNSTTRPSFFFRSTKRLLRIVFILFHFSPTESQPHTSATTRVRTTPVHGRRVQRTRRRCRRLFFLFQPPRTINVLLTQRIIGPPREFQNFYATHGVAVDWKGWGGGGVGRRYIFA